MTLVYGNVWLVLLREKEMKIFRMNTLIVPIPHPGYCSESVSNVTIENTKDPAVHTAIPFLLA